MAEPRDPMTWILLPGLIYAGLLAWMFWPSVLCGNACYVDLPTIHGQLGRFEFADTRLNTWILAWGQHSLSHHPLDIFSANALYPATDSLSGSEHLFGLTLLSWPLRLFTDNAVAIHQITLVLTGFLLALTTCAFVRFFTKSTTLALLAGACAIFMPWRVADLTHIQLLGAHWFPLIWLLALRVSLGEARRNDSVILFIVLALQLLTSFYLAYSISLSLFVCIGVALWIRPPDRRSLVQLGFPIAGAYCLFVLSAIPYLLRAQSGLLVVNTASEPIELGALMIRSWEVLLPILQSGWTQASDIAHSYSIPVAVALAAFFSLWRLAPLRKQPPRAERSIWAATWSLWLIVLFSMVLMLGTGARWGAWEISLPAGWAAALVPGFENMRAPHRWAIQVALAAPLLAGVGLHSLQARWQARDASRNRYLLIAPLYAALLVLFLITVPWRQLPAKESLLSLAEVRAPYEALADFPDDPVIEIPWYTQPTYYVQADSQYMLASTLHWKPIANGFTAHLPGHFKFLRRIAAKLPDPGALTRLRRLVDVRFLVVHLDRLREDKRMAWRYAARSNPALRVLYDQHRTLILEIEQTGETGMWQHALMTTEHRDSTLAGLSRNPLSPETERAELRVSGPTRIQEPIAPDLGIPFSLEITNQGDRIWPGLDPDPEGIVMVQVAWVTPDGKQRGETFWPLDKDMEPDHEEAFEVRLAHPGKAGHYFYCFDLVQRVEGITNSLASSPSIESLFILASDADPGSEPEEKGHTQEAIHSEARGVTGCNEFIQSRRLDPEARSGWDPVSSRDAYSHDSESSS